MSNNAKEGRTAFLRTEKKIQWLKIYSKALKVLNPNSKNDININRIKHMYERNILSEMFSETNKQMMMVMSKKLTQI